LGSNSERPAIEIRRAGPDDANLFGRIADGVFDAPINPTRLSAFLAAAGHLLIVAIIEGEVVGQVAAVVHHHPDKPIELYIDEVGVGPAHQRQGIAREMLTAIFAWGRELGCEEAWVGTAPDNMPARGLYESCGGVAEPFLMYVHQL
jgi:aminoglycoside 6'-N-acetyltransferase I